MARSAVPYHSTGAVLSACPGCVCRQREVHLLLGGSRSASLLTWEVDLKWDANRDPAQRLMMNFRAEEPADGTRNVTIRMVYPVNTVQLTMDRTMTGESL